MFQWTDGGVKPAVSDSEETEYGVTFVPSVAGYSEVPGTVKITVNKAELTLSATAENKTYDGTADATGTISLTGAVDGDILTASGTFAFVDANAGTGKMVNVTNITLTGTESDNYQLSTTTLATTADITPKDIKGAVNHSGR